MKLRKNKPWKPAPEYSKNLSGLTINLLVQDMREATNFVKNILQARIIYEDPDFAAIEGFGPQWCFHTHHTYDSHPFKTITESSIYKGLGIELRLIGCDPDQAEIRAKEKGFKILSNSHDKAHGMRECYILDNDNYCWVPSIII